VNDDDGLPALLATIAVTGNDLTETAKSALSQIAQTLTDNRTLVAEVVGHSDNSSWRNSTPQQSAQKNRELSEKRARTVADYLRSRGVSDAQFRLVEGKGDASPVADNKTLDGRAANRRIEIYLLAGDQMIADARAESHPVQREPAPAETVAESRPSPDEQNASRKPAKTSAGQAFQRGDLMLFARSSGLDIDITSANGYRTTSFELSAGGGYFVIDHLAVTGEIAIGVAKAPNVDAVTSFGLGLGARYYIMKGLFAGVAAGGSKVSGYDDIQGFFGAEAGYDFFLTDHVFFEPAVKVSKNFILDGFEMADGISFGISLGIGVKF
jgi:hypothetical protein